MFFRNFTEHLLKDPKQKFTSEHEAIEYYKKAFKKVTPHLKDILPSDKITG